MGKFAKMSKCKVAQKDGFLETEWMLGKDKLKLETPKRAEKFKDNMYEDKQYINEVELFRYIEETIEL